MVVTDMGALRHQRHHAWQRVDREQTHSGRFKLNLPTIAMGTIGAGAGTAIKVDPLTKKVSLGPKSAGASPDRWRSGWGVPNRRSATVTRSWVGSTDCFLGGKVKLDIEGAERVLQEKVADPLGIDIYEAEGMANLLAMDAKEAVRQMVSARAVDPPPVVPAVPGHPLRRAGRSTAPAGDGQPAARGSAVGGVRARQDAAAVAGAVDAVGRAVTSGSVRRTTSTSPRGSRPPTSSWSHVRSS